VSEFFATNSLDPLHWTQNSCFGAFRTVSLLHESRVGIFRNERTRSTPFDSKLMFWCVSDRFITAQKSMQNWPNCCHYRTSSLNKVASEFFATNAPDPLHLTQNSCFWAFRTVSLLHGGRCKTGQTGGINAKVRKTKLRWNFSHEHTQSTPFDPKFMFWGVSDRFGTAR
jgi:hypothetical protein